MKINIFILSLVAFAAVSCKKSSTPAQENTYLMTVKEYKTNIPLAGVKISLYKCTDYDNVFGCLSKSVFATHTTDENGEYSFTQGEINQATEGVILSKSKYWDMHGGPGLVLMEPEAMVNLTVKASNTYPDTSIFELNTISELGNGNAEIFNAPKDTSFNFRLFGNETNIINWVVYTKDTKCLQYCIRDTLSLGSLILNPQKFETLDATIDY